MTDYDAEAYALEIFSSFENRTIEEEMQEELEFEDALNLMKGNSNLTFADAIGVVKLWNRTFKIGPFYGTRYKF